MLSEAKILFNNIKVFRNLLTENANDSDIAKYIQNHEYIYIYYAGDGENKKGYRTIRPYVLGTSKAGNKVIRAWQDTKKNSVHFDKRATRNDSQFHDYWTDEEGVKPGWRMFRLDRIEAVYPTGKKFHDINGLVTIPAGYNEGGDKDMTSVDTYVSTKTQPDVQYHHGEDLYGNKYDLDFRGDVLSNTEQNKRKWDSIRRGNKNKRKITANDVTKLRDIASRIYKKSRGSFLVVIDDKNNFQIIDVRDKDKKNIPDTAIVGTLTNLYDTLVKQNEPVKDQFFDKTKEKAIKGNQDKTKENQSPTIPFERKPFFKT